MIVKYAGIIVLGGLVLVGVIVGIKKLIAAIKAHLEIP